MGLLLLVLICLLSFILCRDCRSRGEPPVLRVAISRRFTFQHVGEDDIGLTGLPDENGHAATMRKQMNTGHQLVRLVFC
jgi:hypothetical protein